jgi:hypothetical protein
MLHFQTELALYESNLCGHLQQMVYFLRRIPPDQFDYCPTVAAPTPRILATHAWQWLVCDRYHINEPDASKHPPVPDPPGEPEALCSVLEEEIENWRTLLRSLTPEDLLAERNQFNEYPMNVRAFIGHIIQNSIYKNGQLSTLYYALGLDGTEPYDAPFPNAVYEEVFGPRSVEP